MKYHLRRVAEVKPGRQEEEAGEEARNEAKKQKLKGK